MGIISRILKQALKVSAKNLLMEQGPIKPSMYLKSCTSTGTVGVSNINCTLHDKAFCFPEPNTSSPYCAKDNNGNNIYLPVGTTFKWPSGAISTVISYGPPLPPSGPSVVVQPANCIDCTTFNINGVDPDCMVCPQQPSGCTDPNALNYDPTAIIDDGSCIYPSFNCVQGNCEDPGDGTGQYATLQDCQAFFNCNPNIQQGGVLDPIPADDFIKPVPGVQGGLDPDNQGCKKRICCRAGHIEGPYPPYIAIPPSCKCDKYGPGNPGTPIDCNHPSLPPGYFDNL